MWSFIKNELGYILIVLIIAVCTLVFSLKAHALAEKCGAGNSVSIPATVTVVAPK